LFDIFAEATKNEPLSKRHRKQHVPSSEIDNVQNLTDECKSAMIKSNFDLDPDFDDDDFVFENLEGCQEYERDFTPPPADILEENINETGDSNKSSHAELVPNNVKEKIAMDIGWDDPPMEDVDRMLRDEDEI
jgi:hypothetical protein